MEDTVRGFIAVAESPASIGQVINIGSNYEISVGDLAHGIAEVMGTQIEIETDAQRLRPEKSEVERLWASNEKAERLLGWKPQFDGLAGLKRGLGHTAEWFSDPRNLARYKAEIYNI